MAQVERLKLADSTHKAFKNLDERIGTYLEKLNMRFTDEGKHAKERSPNEERADRSEERADADADANIA